MNNTSRSANNTSDLTYLSDFLDSKYKLPGGIGVGWDAILGLIPGVGDLVTSSLSFYILFRSAVRGAPPVILLRMGINILIDNVLDFFPIIGNIFDIFWRSNRRNVNLLHGYLQDPVTSKRQARSSVILSLILITLFAIVVFSAIIWGMYTIGVLIYNYLEANPQMF